MNTEVMFSSVKDDWETPQYLFDKLNDEFHFTLDAAADKRNHKCERYFTKEIDALSQPWDFSTFCNPPYGREIGKFVAKAYQESLLGKTIALLLPSRTDTKWFHDYILGKAEIRFIKGRLKFGGVLIVLLFHQLS